MGLGTNIHAKSTVPNRPMYYLASFAVPISVLFIYFLERAFFPAPCDSPTGNIFGTSGFLVQLNISIF